MPAETPLAVPELVLGPLLRHAGSSDATVCDNPWFENHVATLELEGKHAKIAFEKAITGSSGEPGLEKIFARHLV